MRPIRLVHLIPILLAACAQVADISGGERDASPPELIAADPPLLSTNVSVDRITLTFNERIQLDRVRERLLISPPLSTPPEVRLSGPRTVTIHLTSPLQPNTTYSFSIGEAIKDLTEGNSARGLVHVISTGGYVDSMRIAGKVVNAFSGAPEKDVLVLVHEVNDTGTVRTARPAFATRTNANGDLLLDHLRHGEYRLYALRDQNTNYRFDLPNEEIAFLEGTVPARSPSDTLLVHELRLFKEVSLKQQVRGSKVMPDGALQLVLERPAQRIEIADVARTGGTLQWIAEWRPTQDTVWLWPSDTTAVHLGKYRIATEDGPIDTVAYRRDRPIPFFTGLKAMMMEQTPRPFIQLQASRPIAYIDSSFLQIVKEDRPIGMSVRYDPSDPRKLRIDAPIGPGDKFTFLALPGAITDIYGGRNDTLRAALGSAAEESTGALRIRLQIDDGSEGPFILQLLDAQGSTTMSATIGNASEEIVWDRLMPGKAKLRLIHDRNGNGRWDTGDLDRNMQPEMVWNHPEVLNIRAAWDIGIEWRIGGNAGSGGQQP